MKRTGILVLILAIGVWFFYQRSNSSSSNPITKIFERSRKTEAGRKPASVQVPDSPLVQKLHHEALNIGRIDANPETTEQRLQEWARSLSETDLAQLELAALDLNKPQDDRFLAVMLMAWSEKVEALEKLKDIALAEIDPYLSPNQFGDFERILRMQAVDGILDLPAHGQVVQSTLQTVASKSTESSIVDRANRALWSLEGKAPTPENQDKQALEKVLSR